MIFVILKQWSQGLDWIEQSLMSHSTRFRSFRRQWGDYGISQDCSHSQRLQCAWCWVVCARPLLITVVCMCIIWKALCPCVLGAWLGLWVSLEHAFTCLSTTNQAERCSSATHLLARWQHKRTTALWSSAQKGRAQRKQNNYIHNINQKQASLDATLSKCMPMPL